MNNKTCKPDSVVRIPKIIPSWPDLDETTEKLKTFLTEKGAAFDVLIVHDRRSFWIQLGRALHAFER